MKLQILLEKLRSTEYLRTVQMKLERELKELEITSKCIS